VPEDLLHRRVGQTVLHELGHAFGLHHCRDARCVMVSANNVEMLDEKGVDFCLACAAALAALAATG
jgi:archaemetzincin